MSENSTYLRSWLLGDADPAAVLNRLKLLLASTGSSKLPKIDERQIREVTLNDDYVRVK
jgi:hypothetical protein